MPNLSISKSRRSTSNHSRRSCGGGRNNNNRRTQGVKKKQQGNHNGASVVSSTSSSTTAAIAPYIPKPLSDMRTNILQKFERLSSLIDDTLENDEGIVPINLCADLHDGWMDEKQDEVADDAKSMFDDATFVLGSIEEQTNKVCSKNYYQADGIQDASTDLTAVNTSGEVSFDNRVDDNNNNPSKRSEVRQRQTPSNTNDAVNKSEEAAAAVSKTCTDFTTAASEFNKTGEQRCNFASWLASQEFDASAIVWNGDDNNPQELNTVVEGGGGLNHNEVASIGIMQPRTIGRSRSCEYSRDEFENHIEQDYKNELLKKKKEEEQDNNNNNEDNDGGDDDGYVSIADVTGSKWTNKLKEMGVNNVWEKVTTCTMSSPTSCVQDVDWKCWEGKTPLGKKVNNTAKYLFPKSTPGNAMNQPSILKNDSSFVLDNMEGSPSSNGCQTIHQKSISNGIAEKNKSSAAETNCGAYIGTASLTADGSLLEDKAKNLAVNADQKKPSPLGLVPCETPSSCNKDQEDEDIIKKFGLVPCETPPSSNMPLQPKNLHDSLFSNTSSHVSSLTDRVTTKSGGGPATDSSVATPLLAGEDLLDGGGSITDAFATPARFDDCHVPSDANTPGGIDSCTYSVSPTHHPFSGMIETTAQPAAHLSSELTTITYTSISKSTDPFETTPFPSDNGAQSQQELEDDISRSDTPLMNGFSSSDSNDQTSSSRHSLKAKGRMRRRMRLKN